MSDTTDTSLQHHSPKQKWNKSRAVGVDDIKNKTCWICRDDEASETERRVWIHACDCTLVAHEACLLTWIRLQNSPSGRANPDNLKCPQCKTPFEIVSREFKTLKVLDGVHQQISRAARYSAILVISGGIYSLSTIYGVHAIRWFVGRDVADLILGGRDPSQWRMMAWLHLPLVPFTLMLSSSRLFGVLCTFVPLLIVHPNHEPISFEGIHVNDVLMYPPSPPMILACLPVARFFYRKGHTALVKWLVDSRLGPKMASIEGRPNAEDEVAAEQLPEAERGILQGGMAAALDRGEQVTFTVDALARLFIGSLILPPISALAGEALRRLSTYSSTLQAVLGAQPQFRISTTFMNIVGVGLGVPSIRYKTYADYDPIWWRNTIGLSIFVLARDVMTLWRRYLRVQEKQSRRVLTKPFVKVDYDELDLIID